MNNNWYFHVVGHLPIARSDGMQRYLCGNSSSSVCWDETVLSMHPGFTGFHTSHLLIFSDAVKQQRCSQTTAPQLGNSLYGIYLLYTDYSSG